MMNLVKIKLAKVFIILAICFQISFKLNAQHPMGLVVGDLNTPYAYSLNPALTRSNLSNRAYINWWGASLSLENNFMNYNAPFRISAWINNNYPSDKVKSNGTLSFDQSWLPTDLTVKNWKLNYLNEVHGPSIFIPLDEFGGFGFGVKAVSGFSVDGLNGDLGSILRYGMGSAGLGGVNDLIGKTIKQSEFSINAEKYQEWFMTFAGYSESDVVNSWRWGFTAKFLLGMGMAHLGSDNLDATIVDNQTIMFNQMNSSYYHTNDLSVATALSGPFGLKFDFVNGAGLGGDLGFMYEYRPNAKSNYNGVNFCDQERFEQYKWKFGASITDLGFISYDGRGSEIISIGDYKYTIDKDIVNDLQHTQGADRFDKLDDGLFNPAGGQDLNTFLSYSPTALNVQFDNALNNNVHLGAYWTQSLKPTNSVGLKRASYLSVVPRYQAERIEFGMPITLANDYTALNWGIYGRIGPVIIGSDNLVGLGQFIKNDHYTGASFYFGFRSKIGDCERTYKRTYNQIERDVKDSQPVAKKTTTRDTVFVQKIVKDTVYVNKTPNTQSNISAEQVRIKEADLKKKEEALKLKEQEVKIKEEGIKAKQLELDKLNAMNSADCNKKVAILTADLNKAKAELDKSKLDLQTLDNQCKTAKNNSQITADKAQSDLSKEKAKNMQLTSELEKLKLQIGSGNNCAKQTKQLDSLWKIESKKNSDLNAELALAKGSYATFKNKCDESDKKLTQLQAEIAEIKNKSAVSNNCCEKLIKLEIDLAYEKEKNATIQAELLKAKATNDAQVVQIEKVNADLKAATDKLKLASEFKVAEDCTPYKTKAAQLDAKVLDLNKTIGLLQAQVTTLTADKKICEEKLKSTTNIGASEDCNPYKLKIADLEKKNTELTAKNTTITAQASALQNQIVTLTAEKKSAEDKLKLATSSSTEDCTPYKFKVTELEKQINAVKADLAKANATIEACNKVKADLTIQAQKATDLEVKITAAAAEKNKIQDDLNNANAKITDLEAKLKASSSTNCDELQTLVNQLKSELAGKNDKISKLSSDLGLCTKDLEDLKTKNEDCQKELEMLKGDDAALRKQIIRMDEEMGQLGAIIKSKDTEIAKLKSQVSALQADLKKCNDTLNPPTEPAAPGGGN
jgi:predicted  nucleic acid-binding Zn-ribbon protein